MTVEEKEKLIIYIMEEYTYGWMDAMLALCMYNIHRSHVDRAYISKHIKLDILPTSINITLII